MNDRLTPETDAAVTTFISISKLKKRFECSTGKVSAEFARRMERERDEARGERDALRDAVNALHDYVHGKRNDDKDISEILNGAMKI